MVATPLSESQIAAGRALLDRLDAGDVRVDAAVWYYFTDRETWRLVLSLPDVIRRGPKAAYTEVQRVLSGVRNEIALELADVTIARPGFDPLDPMRAAGIRTAPGFTGQLRFTQCVFNGEAVEDALVYRLRHSGNGVRHKKRS